MSTVTAPGPSRRGLLSRAAAAIAVGSAAATPSAAALASPAAPFGAAGDADAELIAIARQFAICDAELMRLGRACADDEGAFDAVHELWWSLVDRVADIPASTEAGRVAKASILPAIIRDCAQLDEPEVIFANSLLRDILGASYPGPPADPSPHPDATLIGLCDRLVAIEAEREALVDADPDAPDSGLNKPRHDALWDEWRAVRDLLYDLDYPTTTAGVTAISRVAMTQIDRDCDGEPEPRDFFEWLALGAILYRVGSAAAALSRERPNSPSVPNGTVGEF